MIRAPFDGVAISKDAQPGEIVSPVSAGGGFTRTGIGTIVDMTSLEIEVDVNEAFIQRVRAAPAGAGDAAGLPRVEDPRARDHHGARGRSPEGDGEGAHRVRPARRPAHPARHGREGGVSGAKRTANADAAAANAGSRAARCAGSGTARSSSWCATIGSSGARLRSAARRATASRCTPDCAPGSASCSIRRPSLADGTPVRLRDDESERMSESLVQVQRASTRSTRADPSASTCSRGSISTCRRASSSRSWGRPARARRRCST